MYHNNLLISDTIALDMIRKDAKFYYELSQDLIEKGTFRILFHGFIPYYSLFIVESHLCLNKIFPEQATSLSYSFQSILKSSRMRIKLFEDKQMKIEDFFYYYAWINQSHHNWYKKTHTGLFARIKRALQDDLGLFYYQNHIIGSTHTSLINYGIGQNELINASDSIVDVLIKVSFPLGEEIGRYLSQILYILNHADKSMDWGNIDYKLNNDLLGYVDLKSEKFFNLIFDGKNNKSGNISLLLFLTYINSLHYLLNNLSTSSSFTLFKLKYIVLYQTTMSLKKMYSYCYQNNVLKEQSLTYIQTIISDKNLQKLMVSSFRNILVHYEFRKVPVTIIDRNIKLYGLVEYFFDGKSYDDLAIIIDKQIERISILFEDWLNNPIKQNQIQKW